MAKFYNKTKPEYILELSYEEAHVLYDITRWGIVGGGRRWETDAIHSALRPTFGETYRPKDMAGEITFTGKGHSHE